MKYYTADPFLLLSFVYFDQTHCGYILDKDVEEIIHTLGLQLSRSQVQNPIIENHTSFSQKHNNFNFSAKTLLCNLMFGVPGGGGGLFTPSKFFLDILNFF
jgi:hypothetical protein